MRWIIAVAALRERPDLALVGQTRTSIDTASGPEELVLVTDDTAGGIASTNAGARLDRAFFNRPTLRVARDLLGKVIVRVAGGHRIAATITEVEAYLGPADLASHARNGRRTKRVEPLYADGGTVYVYFVYGMHWLLNFSTAGLEKPEAVLIRAVLVENGGEANPVIGPGRVTRALEIDKSLDGVDATSSKEIWVEDRGVRFPARRIQKTPRIGIHFAGEYWAAKPWRFHVEVKRFGQRG